MPHLLWRDVEKVVTDGSEGLAGLKPETVVQVVAHIFTVHPTASGHARVTCGIPMPQRILGSFHYLKDELTGVGVGWDVRLRVKVLEPPCRQVDRVARGPNDHPRQDVNGEHLRNVLPTLSHLDCEFTNANVERTATCCEIRRHVACRGRGLATNVCIISVDLVPDLDQRETRAIEVVGVVIAPCLECQRGFVAQRERHSLAVPCVELRRVEEL